MSGLEQTIPDGYQLTEVGVIPEDWSVKQVSKAFEICNTLRFPLSAKVRESMVGEYPYYGPTKIQDYINEYRIDGEYALIGEDGDHFLKFETVPQTQLAKGRFNVNNHAHVIKGKTASTEWFYLYFKHREITSHLSRQGAGRYKLNKATLEQIPCAVPSLKEQTAIANALSDVDALLSELDKLISKKQAIKTATMQQLLTGKTRLPQFATYTDGDKQGQTKGTKPSELGEIPEDWDVKALSSMLNATPSYGINAAAVPLVGNLPVYIRITDISEDGYFKPSKRVGVNSPLSDLYKLQIGDLVLARTGASVGKSYLYRESDGELVFAGFLIRVSPNEKKLISEYLSHYLKTDKYWAWVTVNSMRSGQPGINGNEFGSLPLPIPSTEEQTAIATILSDIDEEIQALKQRLSKTRQIKQGMMQELLTGKTRLPFDKTNMKLQGEPHAD
ncbi:MAG: restriction endonuclease subunit S [Vibrio cyclitrophicus]